MLLLSLFLACENAKPLTPGTLPTEGKALVTVNGNKISEGVVDALLSQVPEDKRAEIKSSPAMDRLKEQLITTEILYQEALKANLHTQESNKVAMALAQREVLANAIVSKLAESRVTDEKMKAWYDDHLVQFKKEEADLSVILAESEAKANAAIAKLNGGAKFADVVNEYSMDQQTKINGGAMGPIDLRGFPPNIVEALNKTQDGQLTAPVPMGGSYAVFKVNSRNSSLTPLEEVKDQIKEQMLQEEAQAVQKELREKATVTTPEDSAASITVPEAPAAPVAPTAPAAPASTPDKK